MTKKLFVTVGTNQVGTDGHYFIEVPDDMTEDSIEDIIWELALENADMYGIYPPGEWDEVNDDGEFEEGDENIGGGYEIYNSEKHDGYTYSGKPDWIQY